MSFYFFAGSTGGVVAAVAPGGPPVGISTHPVSGLQNNMYMPAGPTIGCVGTVGGVGVPPPGGGVPPPGGRIGPGGGQIVGGKPGPGQIVGG